MASRLSSFLAELKRRKVYHVAVVYVLVGLAVAQGADWAFDLIELPNIASQLVAILIVLGFPIAVVLAWAYEIRPEEPKPPEPTIPTAEAKDRNSIIVLPFDNMSPDPGDAYFSDGLTEEIITSLSQIHSLRVISRSSAMILKGTQKDVRTIGRELDVQYVLEGSVRKAGEELRITAQLIDANTDEHKWAEKYAGVLGDVFSIQEAVSRSIAEALELEMTTEEERCLTKRPIDDVQAYDCHLRARHETLRWTRRGLERATRYLKDGIEIVGENAALLFGLGYVQVTYVWAGLESGEEGEECLTRADDYASKIFALESDSPQGHCLLGLTHFTRNRQREAISHLRKVLRQDPTNPDAIWILMVLYFAVGKVEPAAPLAKLLLETDPLSPITHNVVGAYYLMAGHPQRALAAARRIFELEPEDHLSRHVLVLLLLLNDLAEEAKSHAEGWKDDTPENVSHWVLSLYAAALRQDRSELNRLAALDYSAAAKGQFDHSWHVAHCFALVGDSENAVNWLKNSVSLGFINYPVLSRDPVLAKLKDEPRFIELMESVHREWERFEV
jgi:TolB-like protein/Flp pilus assembly protein TadD